MYDDDAFDRGAIDASEFDDAAIGVVRQIVVAALFADGMVDKPELTTGVDVVQRFGAVDYSADDLNTDLTVLTRDGLFEAVQDLADSLSYESRAALVDAAVAVACSNGTVDRWELSVAREVGEALRFPRDQVEGFIDREVERLSQNLQ